MKYSNLVELYEQLEATTKRLEKTALLSEFLKKNKPNEQVVLLLQGRVFPNWDQRELGIAARILVKAIALAAGMSAEKVEKIWKETGDLGDCAEKLVKTKKQSTLFSKELTCQKVFENLQKIATFEGEGTVDKKVQLVAELLTSAQPNEAKYIVRTIIGALRIGLGDGTIRDAIVLAFFGKEAKVSYDKKENNLVFEKDRTEYEKYLQLVQEACDIINDFGEVVEIIGKKGESGLHKVSLLPGRPVKVMLFQKAQNVKEGLECVGTPCAVEFKYDGFRLQIHKKKDKITLYTRRLENVTEQFPDVVEIVKKNVKGDEYILDTEAIGIDAKTHKYLPFQSMSQRIKRKYDIEEVSKLFPVEVNVFDILYLNGEDFLQKPFQKRREAIEKIVRKVPQKLNVSEMEIVEDENLGEKFYKKSLDAGNEGIMMKNLSGIYKPGSRVGFGVKVKPTMDTLEVAIVGANWGEGKRGKWLSSFTIAVFDSDTNVFVEIGKVGTGIKEKEEEGVSFGQLTELLKPHIIREEGKDVFVTPIIVIEVNYEEIQTSPSYSSGYALRFPRFVRLRDDRTAREINTLEDVKALAKKQRGR